MRKILGLIAFFLTGAGLLITALISEFAISNLVIVALFSIFFVLGVGDHFRELRN